MAAHVGRTRLLFWGDTSPQVAVAGIREFGPELAGEPVDVTNNDSAGVRTLIDAASVSEMTISVSGVLLDDTLRADWFGGTAVDSASRYQDATFQYALELAQTVPAEITGKFYLSEYSETGSHDGEITFEATFMSAGAVTYTPGS